MDNTPSLEEISQSRLMVLLSTTRARIQLAQIHMATRTVERPSESSPHATMEAVNGLKEETISP
jgi:hypothetical protein